MKTDAAVQAAAGRSPRATVWDLPLRITHWAFVAAFGFSWWTAENDKLEWHTWSGYALLGFLIFRIYWGLAGSTTARFSHFLRGPKAVWQYSQGLFRRGGTPFVGHNPLGGWSTLLILAFLLSQVLLGLFSEDVDGLASGPLSYKVSYDTGRWAAETHEALFDGLLIVIGLHVAAILFYLLYKRNNLIAPMVTGKLATDKKEEAGTEPLYIAPLWRAVPGIILAGVVIGWIVKNGVVF
ncbi:cytochrome b/b6 domain-containing protein [Gilvimarinus sp. F26214L]|uniref:cytochrome b/b6 domain-containing protein n=1 Tax=Gilvimarinus sp. DZF01 TaxID=3461371 RepID=UPI0040468096